MRQRMREKQVQMPRILICMTEGVTKVPSLRRKASVDHGLTNLQATPPWAELREAVRRKQSDLTSSVLVTTNKQEPAPPD